MAKKRKKTPLEPTLNCNLAEVKESDKYVPQECIIAYLHVILKRYAGYNFISISKSFSTKKDDKAFYFVLICVHKTLPAQIDGMYHGTDDIRVSYKFTSNPTFQGMVMDKSMNYVLGNPFRIFEEKKEEPNTVLSADTVEVDSVEEHLGSKVEVL